MKFYFSILLLLVFNASFACSCNGTPNMEKAVDETNVIISGKVLSKKSLSKKDGQQPKYFDHNVKYEILVTKAYKGKINNKIITIVTGPAIGGDCGYFFEIGKTYTIYARNLPVFVNGKKVNEFIETSICTRTNKFDETESDKIEKYCKSKGYS